MDASDRTFDESTSAQHVTVFAGTSVADVRPSAGTSQKNPFSVTVQQLREAMAELRKTRAQLDAIAHKLDDKQLSGDDILRLNDALFDRMTTRERVERQARRLLERLRQTDRMLASRLERAFAAEL